jgi:hypothetical protein
MVVAGACAAAALLSAAAAGAAVPSAGFSASPVMTPMPQADMMCDLMSYCDTGLDLVVTGRSERMEPEFGGGFLTPNPVLADD